MSDAEEYDRDRIGSVVAFAQSHPWLALVGVCWAFACLLLWASAVAPRRRR